MKGCNSYTPSDVEMPRRDPEPADQHSGGGLRVGAPGGLQDGDCAGAQVSGETQRISTQ